MALDIKHCYYVDEDCKRRKLTCAEEQLKNHVVKEDQVQLGELFSIAVKHARWVEWTVAPGIFGYPNPDPHLSTQHTHNPMFG